MRRGWLAAALGVAVASIAAASAGAGPGRLPAGVAPPPVPADNPTTPAKVALGRRLFHDADLSIDGTMSCASCHEQHRAFAHSSRTRPGVADAPGRRNVPGLANVAWARTLTWADSRLETLEAQVLVPILGDHPVEMGMKDHEAEIPKRLGADPCYVRMFGDAFPELGGRIDMVTVARALAAFQRTMLSYDTPYDRFRAGRRGALTPIARQGVALFETHCAGCHAGPNFSDGRYHRLAGPAPDAPDRGLGEVTGRPDDDGRFRTPNLRNVGLTAPYLHDGSADTLADAIARHGPAVPDFAVGERAALVAMLEGLTDRRFVTDRRFAYPDRVCGRRT